ncbi:unnamed protein product, partial [Coregonus sp. 'balchen']
MHPIIPLPGFLRSAARRYPVANGDVLLLCIGQRPETSLEQHNCLIGACNVATSTGYSWTHSAIVLDPTGSLNAEHHMSENLVKLIGYDIGLRNETYRTGTVSVFSNVPWQATTIPPTKQRDSYNCGVYVLV